VRKEDDGLDVPELIGIFFVVLLVLAMASAGCRIEMHIDSKEATHAK
jgi:hypothetical protein